MASGEAPVSGGVCSRAPPVALDQGRPICRHDARCDRLRTRPGRNDPCGPSPGPGLCAPRSRRALDCNGPSSAGSVLPPGRLDRSVSPSKIRRIHDFAPRRLSRLRARARDGRVVRPRLTRPIRTADTRTRSGAVLPIRVPDRRPREPVFQLLRFRHGGCDAPLAISRGALDRRRGRRGVQCSWALRGECDPRPELRARSVLHPERLSGRSGQPAGGSWRARGSAASRNGQLGRMAPPGIRGAGHHAARAAPERGARPQRPAGTSRLGRDRRALAVSRGLVGRRRVPFVARAAGALRPTGRRAARERQLSFPGHKPAAGGGVVGLSHWTAGVAWRTGSPRPAIAVRYERRAGCARAGAMRHWASLLAR